MEEVYPRIINIFGGCFAGPFSDLVIRGEVKCFFFLLKYFFKLKRKLFSSQGPLCGTFVKAGNPSKTSVFIFFQIEKEIIFLFGNKAALI